jgi:hypothetical protein
MGSMASPSFSWAQLCIMKQFFPTLLLPFGYTEKQNWVNANWTGEAIASASASNEGAKKPLIRSFMSPDKLEMVCNAPWIPANRKKIEFLLTAVAQYNLLWTARFISFLEACNLNIIKINKLVIQK